MRTIEEITKAFGSVPRQYTKSADIIAAGYLTEEEFGMLPQCPREGKVESCSKWPTIGGRTTYPMSGCLTPEERATYNNFHRDYQGGATRKLAVPEGMASKVWHLAKEANDTGIMKFAEEVLGYHKSNEEILEEKVQSLIASGLLREGASTDDAIALLKLLG